MKLELVLQVRFFVSKRPVFLVGTDRTNDRSEKSTQTFHFRMDTGCVRDRQLFLSQEGQSDLKCDILVKRDFITVHRCPAPMKERYGKGRSAMKEIQIHTLAETAALAQQLADLLPRPALITLSGDLGAGKTTFTKALGKALGVKRTINSPTFTILKSYPMGDGTLLHHIDAYRLEGIHQELGIEECFDEGVSVVEWPDFILEALPAQRLEIRIHNEEGEQRRFVIEGHGEAYAHIAEELK